MACGGGQTYLTPEIAGVVTKVEGPGNATRFELANGLEFVIDITDGRHIGYGGSPNPGDLLLGGTGPDGPWVARLPLASGREGCFWIDGGGTDRGRWIETDNGFRLPKADQFDPGVDDEAEGGHYETAVNRRFCLNGEGQVTSFGP